MMAKRGIRMSNADFRALWFDLSISSAEIGRRLGISGSAVRQRARARGLPTRGYNRYGQYLIGPDRQAEFVALWQAGVLSRDIAAHYSTHCITIADNAARLGLPRRGKSWQHRGITLAEYRQRQINAALSASAAETRAQILLGEMADRIGSRMAA